MIYYDLKIMIGLVCYKYLRNSDRRINNIFWRCTFLFHLNVLNISLHGMKTKPPWNVLFYGTDEFSVESLKCLNNNRTKGSDHIIKELDVVTIPKMKSISVVRKYACDKSLQIFDWPYTIPENKYDIGVVASFGHLIPSKTIAAFPWGMINVHASLLPRWRGAAPIVHTILHGDKETGVTIMQIEPKYFDVGKILLQESCKIPDDITTKQLTRVLSKLGAQLLLKSLSDLPTIIENGKFQDPSLITLAPKITSKNAKICWESHTCSDIDRHYRALPENLKLQTYWNGYSVKLLDMVSPKIMNEISINIGNQKPHNNMNKSFGYIFYHKKHKLLCVKCKDGWVAFHKLSISGFKQMTAMDFKNGFLSKVDEKQLFFTNQ